MDFARVFKVAVTKNISTVYAKFVAIQNVKECTVDMVIFSGFDFNEYLQFMPFFPNEIGLFLPLFQTKGAIAGLVAGAWQGPVREKRVRQNHGRTGRGCRRLR